MKKVAILTAGGDCPGLNTVIRAITRTAIKQYGLEVMGILDGYRGLVEDRTVNLTLRSVEDILDRGGTILGSSNKDNPFAFLEKKDSEPVDMSQQCIAQLRAHGVDCLFTIGGDGTLTSARDFSRMGFPVIGIPKTIDNDLNATDQTFGFNTAVTTATEAMDKLRTTAEAHHRIAVVEIMGRYAGWLTLESGIAGGASVILIPEIPYDFDKVCEAVKKNTKNGKNYTIVAVSEGSKPIGGEVVIRKLVTNSPDAVRLGGIANKLAEELEERLGIEARATVLGHIQRGGQTSPFDRVLSTKYGVEAVELAMRGQFGRMVAMIDGKISSSTLEDAVGKLKTVPVDHELIKVARMIGVSFGD
jgi:6-phosphofructokinase 1